MKEQILDSSKIVLVTFLFTAAIIPIIKKIAVHVGAIDIPRADEGHRHIHKKATPMFGGVGIFLGFLFGYMLFGEQSIRMNSILIGSFIIILTGIIDDIVYCEIEESHPNLSSTNGLSKEYIDILLRVYKPSDGKDHLVSKNLLIS